MANQSKSMAAPRLRFPEFRQADDWRPASVGAKTTAFSGGTPDTSRKELYGGNIRFIRSAEIGKESTELTLTEAGLSASAAKLVVRGDVLVALYGANSGEVALAKIDGAINQAILCLRSEDNNAFLYQYLCARKDWITAKYLQGGQGNLSGDIVKSIVLGFPSKFEQQKIADCLMSLDEVIAAQGRKVEALKTYKRGLMQQLFPREGETVPRLRFPEFRDAPEWNEAPIGELFDTKSGGTPDRSKMEYWKGSIPWVTTSLVDFNIITAAEEFISDSGLENSSAKIFPTNTVLIAMYGQGKTRGKVALLGISASTNQACAAILPGKDIDPLFTFANLCGRYDEMRALSNSGGQENLSQDLIRQLPFRYPKNTEEQSKIVGCLSSIDMQIAAESKKLDVLKFHKKGLMQQLFPSLEDVL
jgi:type I restriction enzyme S subunit